MTQEQLKNLIKRLRGPHTIGGFIIAFTFLLVCSILIFNWTARRSETPATAEPVAESQSLTYTVQPGDSTWKIAERFYQDGSRYVELEKANNLSINAELEIGQVLVVPATGSAQATSEVKNTAAEPTVITPMIPATRSLEYTVQAGDSLWKIAERELGNPYRWTELYAGNTAVVGQNPDLIHPGQVLQLPLTPAVKK